MPRWARGKYQTPQRQGKPQAAVACGLAPWRVVIALSIRSRASGSYHSGCVITSFRARYRFFSTYSRLSACSIVGGRLLQIVSEKVWMSFGEMAVIGITTTGEVHCIVGSAKPSLVVKPAYANYQACGVPTGPRCSTPLERARGDVCPKSPSLRFRGIDRLAQTGRGCM